MNAKTETITFEGFAASDMAPDAVIRNLESIGEACRNIERSDPICRDCSGRPGRS